MPTSTVVLACALGFAWLIIQARLEEVDLLQRLPAYREYMEQVPRFLPRLRERQPSMSEACVNPRGQGRDIHETRARLR